MVRSSASCFCAPELDFNDEWIIRGAFWVCRHTLLRFEKKNKRKKNRSVRVLTRADICIYKMRCTQTWSHSPKQAEQLVCSRYFNWSPTRSQVSSEAPKELVCNPERSEPRALPVASSPQPPRKVFFSCIRLFFLPKSRTGTTFLFQSSSFATRQRLNVQFPVI